MEKYNNCRYLFVLLTTLIVGLNKVHSAAVNLESDMAKSVDTQEDLNTANTANIANSANMASITSKMNFPALQGFNDGYQYIDMFVPVQVPLQQQLWHDDSGIVRLRRSSPYHSQEGFGNTLPLPQPPCPNNYMFTCQPNLASVPCANSNSNNNNNNNNNSNNLGMPMVYQQPLPPQFPALSTLSPLPPITQRYQQSNVAQFTHQQYPPAGAYSNPVPVYVQPVPVSASVQSLGDQ